MIRHRLSLLFFVAALLCGPTVWAANSALVSTMRNVNAVSESRGFYLTQARDRSGGQGFGALAPIQSFEIIRPNSQAVSIGRLYTSCTCVQATASKRTFGSGERAIIELKNVHPTPPAGQMYAVYVQITSPIRATLRVDTFVQSSQFVSSPAPEPAPIVAAAEPEPESESIIDRAVEEARDAAEAASAFVEPAAEAVGDAASAAAESTEELVEEAEKTVSALVQAVRDDAAEETETADAGRPLPAGTVAMEQRLSMITLGVTDLPRAREFYEALGWKPVSQNKYDGMVFFQLNGMAITLYPMSELLRDQDREGHSASAGGITLGYNVREKNEVEAVYNTFVEAGGTSLKKPEEMPWGSVVAYVADPDGHPWEISWVPQMVLDRDGNLRVK